MEEKRDEVLCTVTENMRELILLFMELQIEP
jgi:hypothetical protein